MGTVLVVDDDEDLRVFFAFVISGEGHRVHTAASGEEALTKLRAATCDLVLTDVCLPRMTGLELIEAAHRICPVPFIVMSGYDGDPRSGSACATKALRLGARAFYIKPIDTDVLLQSIHAILSFAPAPAVAAAR